MLALYQAKSWDRARHMVAKVEWHNGELFPRVGFIVTNLSRAAGCFDQTDISHGRHLGEHLTKTGLLLHFRSFLRNPLSLSDGACEGNRTLVSTYPVLFLCKPLLYEGKACIVRFRELH